VAGTEDLSQVTVVTVTFNSAHCLPALGASLSAFPHVIVVDNGSDDDCARQTPTHLPQARVQALPHNLGFGAANNRALAQVQTPFALLLNPDCEISIQAVQQLLRTAAQWPDAAMVAPQLLQANGQPEVNYRWPSLLWKSVGPAVTEGPACVGFVCGAAMLLRMNAFDGQFLTSSFFFTTKTTTCVPACSSSGRPCSLIRPPQPFTAHAAAYVGAAPCAANTSGATIMPSPN